MTAEERKVSHKLDDLIMVHSSVSTYAEFNEKVEAMSLREKCRFLESLIESINNSSEFKELKSNHDVSIFYYANKDFVEFVMQINNWFCPLFTFPA